jgi:hypothetical protein
MVYGSLHLHVLLHLNILNMTNWAQPLPCRHSLVDTHQTTWHLYLETTLLVRCMRPNHAHCCHLPNLHLGQFQW